MKSMHVSSVRPHELVEALELFHHRRSERIADTIRAIECGNFSLNDILVARESGIVGVVLCAVLPGASAMVWPPVTQTSRPDIEDLLIEAAIEHARSAKFLHTFALSQDADAIAPALLRGGFRYITRVWEMCRLPDPCDNSSNSISLIPFSMCDKSTFQHILMEAHSDSMDCPELHGIRNVDEVLAGYRAVAPDLNQWFLAVEDYLPTGTLLMADNNIAFLGIIPNARGRGIGRQLLRSAFDKVKSPLKLIVDARNYRAYRLYRSEGFYVTDSFEFFMHDLK